MQERVLRRWTRCLGFKLVTAENIGYRTLSVAIPTAILLKSIGASMVIELPVESIP